jgi:HlyD family secretion protein
MRGKWLLVSGTVLLLAVAAGTLSVLRKPAPTPPSPKQAVHGPQAGDEISLNGRIQAAHIVAVAAPVDGTLDRWLVEAGQEVLEEQELGHIRNTGLESAQQQAEQELDRAQSRVSNLEAGILAGKLEAARAESDASRTRTEAARLEKLYAREQLLYREGATARLKFEKAEKEYRAAQEEANTAAELARSASERVSKLEKELDLARKVLEEKTAALEEAKEDLKSATILSPAEGLIIKLAVDAGAEVDRSMRDLVQIAVDPALLEIVVEPEPPVLEKLRPGQPALVTVPEAGPDAMQGQIKHIKDSQVIIEFTSPTPAIKHGMTGAVKLKLM